MKIEQSEIQWIPEVKSGVPERQAVPIPLVKLVV
jgi:hypothetical protein